VEFGHADVGGREGDDGGASVGAGLARAEQRQIALDVLARLAEVEVEASAAEEESAATFAVFKFQGYQFTHIKYAPDEKNGPARTGDPLAQGSFLLRRPVGSI
jgi:hypothetical protein